MNKQTKGITPEQILLQLELLEEEGYEKICDYTDGLGPKIILGKQEKFAIISVNYATLKPHVVTLDKETIDKMFWFGKER